MTYEPQPGELVLVRGEIRGKHTRNIDEILGWTVLVVNEVDGENYIDVRAADVVGPATPTAGDESADLKPVYESRQRFKNAEIDRLRNDLQANEAKYTATVDALHADLEAAERALRVAEARIAAALALHQRLPDDRDWCVCSYSYPCATRRALTAPTEKERYYGEIPIDPVANPTALTEGDGDE